MVECSAMHELLYMNNMIAVYVLVSEEKALRNSSVNKCGQIISNF